ncbi:hypothetical protein [Sphingosinicella rhizophila]|uniref:Terminase small subunit n=1 Tax=Sphingosinicella rhizophila TaxID=3050082 RepID=A0ABU3Q647_9SPHN|nr:hypothetical protein [Sphingosinicella sp. GR2756]MDT9598549.1 hypothetical protein [Sphingosinicella sp. GR2756]
MSKEPPKLRLASSQADNDVKRQRAGQELRWPLKELAANMMRIVRGAGRPEDVGHQCAAVLAAYQAYREATERFPPPEVISEALTLPHREVPGGDRLRQDIEDADEMVVDGSLQIAASRLLDQMTQVAAGREEMRRGVREGNDARAAHMAEFERKRVGVIKRPKRKEK